MDIFLIIGTYFFEYFVCIAVACLAVLVYFYSMLVYSCYAAITDKMLDSIARAATSGKN